MKAAQYHRVVTRAQESYALAVYIDSTARMVQEQDAATETIRNAWITSAPPLPGCRVEHSPDGTGWRPI